jgi:hypothetical protein
MKIHASTAQLIANLCAGISIGMTAALMIVRPELKEQRAKVKALEAEIVTLKASPQVITNGIEKP